MNKTIYFLEIFNRAEKKYGSVEKRLAGEGWKEPWQTLIATIMSAQSRDETTIPIAESLFAKYDLKSLAYAKYSDVLKIFRSLNYNRTKAKNVISCSRALINDFNGKVPDTIDELVKLPGVGRKTANLIITECFGKDGICVDTHVHRIANVFGFVKTKSPNETEIALREIVPLKYWSRINRIFVLWGKEVTGNDKEKLLKSLDK
ncbi:MAG: endonuclease III domain-containing protein [Candidatus Pacearchaeota archaeon]